MSTRTEAELIAEALDALGIVGAGQTPELEDTTRIQELIPSIIAMLAATEIVYVPDVGNISQEFFKPLADIIAWECRGKFGAIDPEDLANLQIANESARRQLKVMQRGRPTYRPLQTQYI